MWARDRGDPVERSPGIAGTNLEHARSHNRRVVIETVRLHGPLSRAEIARATELYSGADLDHHRDQRDRQHPVRALLATAVAGVEHMPVFPGAQIVRMSHRSGSDQAASDCVMSSMRFMIFGTTGICTLDMRWFFLCAITRRMALFTSVRLSAKAPIKNCCRIFISGGIHEKKKSKVLGLKNMILNWH